MTRGCLLIHGLTGTPDNLVFIAQALQAKGYLVEAPLLKGHGPSLKILSQTKWQDWYDSVVEAYDRLKQQTTSIYYVGLSMGSLLGFKLAADCTRPLQGIAAIAPPYRLKPLFRNLIIPSVRYTPLRFFLHYTAKNFEKSVKDPHNRLRYFENSLHKMPTQSVFEMEKLVNVIEPLLPQVHQPLLLLYAAQDHLVDFSGFKEIQKKVRSKNISLKIYPNSAHVLTLDYDYPQVAQDIVEFFDAHRP